MKKIEAIIRPEKLPAVRKALEGVGYPGLTITDVRGHGTQRGITQQYRGKTFVVDLIHKAKVEVVVRDGDAPAIVNAIVESARTGEVGDGKIFIYALEDAVRVRTGETGQKAL